MSFSLNIMTDITIIIKQKQQKENNCKCKPNGIYLCKNCRKINQRMCKNYHLLTKELESYAPKSVIVQTAAQELFLRLLYEYMFDIISIHEIAHGEWKSKQNIRDEGHQKRMMKLYNNCCNNSQYVPQKFIWLFEGENQYLFISLQYINFRYL